MQLESVRYQWRHNLLAYMTYIYSILNLQCIIGRFSTVAIFCRFVRGKDFVAVFWSIFLVIKAKQDQSGSSFLFNLSCEWFFDRFLGKIEVTGQTGWEWKLHPCLGVHSGSLKKILVARTHNLGAPGARAPVRQQPCRHFRQWQINYKTSFIFCHW